MKPLLRRAATLTAMATAAAAALTAVGAATALAADANDAFSGATALAAGVNSVAIANTDSTEANEPSAYSASIGNDPGSACYGGYSRWYSLPSTATNGQLVISSASADFDGLINVWSEDIETPDIGDLSSGTGSLRPTSAGQSTITIDLHQGKQYFLDVDSCNKTTATFGTVTFAVAYVPRPANDNFSGALGVSDGQTITVSNAGASHEDSEPDPYSASSTAAAHECYGGASLWYSVPAAPAITITTPTGPAYDSTISLWSYATGSPSSLGALSGVAGIRPQASGNSTFTQNLDPAMHYWLTVDACNDGLMTVPAVPTGSTSFTVSLRAPDTLAPAITITAPTAGATFAQQSYVTVSATVSDAGSGVKSVTLGIDQVASQTLAGNASGTYTAQIPVGSVETGTYTVDVSATDNANNTADKTESILIEGTPPSGYTGATTGTVSAGSGKGVSTSGGVSKVKNKSGGGYGLKATRKGQKITILFVGSRIDLHFAATRIAGIASISIDGKVVKLDTYSKKAHDLLKALKNLKAGKHKVVITITGKKNAKSAGLSVLLTLFRVYV